MSGGGSKISVVDPDAAARRLREHLDAVWESGRAAAAGWRRFQLEPLRWIVNMPATDPHGKRTHFFARLDARRYDAWPPEVQFVEPDGWQPVSDGRWWPLTDPFADSERPRWFGLHPHYDFGDGDPRPLVCFAHSLGYYESREAPRRPIEWHQGEHTVATTLDRLAEILAPPYFRGPSR